MVGRCAPAECSFFSPPLPAHQQRGGVTYSEGCPGIKEMWGPSQGSYSVTVPEQAHFLQHCANFVKERPERTRYLYREGTVGSGVLEFRPFIHLCDLGEIY